jgi:hypothetical protein
VNRVNASVIILFLTLAAVLGGCSTEGDLRIINDSSTTFTGKLKGKKIQLNPGEEATEVVYIGKTLLFVGPDEIDIILGGSAYTKRPFSEDLVVKNGETTTYTVIDDAGAFFFKNNHSTYVSEIYIKAATDTVWSDNLLEEGDFLYPSATKLLQLDTNRYMFKVEYSKDELLNFFSDTISVGEVKYHGWKP